MTRNSSLPSYRRVVRWAPVFATALLSLVAAAPATAAITPSRDANVVAGAFTDSLPTGVFGTASFTVIPPPPSATFECSDGIDNDSDGKIDFTPPAGETADTGCEAFSGGANDNREDDDAPGQCANGFDDDGDNNIDFNPPAGETADPGCSSAQDDQEQDGDPNPTAQCSNGDDDDGDGKIDFTAPTGQTADPGCSSAGDLDEGSEGLPVGQDTNPAATANSPLAGFPTNGGSFAVLSSGNTEFADDPNESGSTGQSNGDGPGTETHGQSVHDLVTLKVNVNVPMNANCLRFDFRFASDEFPEYVGSQFNDAFLAELDGSDFTIDSSDPDNPNPVSAPKNFAFDGSGKVVSINTAGFSAAEAAGTTYDGATPLLRATTPITPGAHSIYLSVFDQGDSALDSAAFIDKMTLSAAQPGTCTAGASSDVVPPETMITGGPSGPTNDNTPPFTFTSSETGSIECRVDSAAFAPCTSPYTPSELSDGSHTFEARAIDSSGNVDPTAASRTVSVDTAPPDTSITSGPSGLTNDSTPTFGFSSTEAGSSFECRVDSGAFAACTSPRTTSALSDGSHTFEVRAKDAAGNLDPTPATRTVTVDATAPNTTIDGGPIFGFPTGDSTPTFMFSSSEGGSTFECKVDGGAFASCSSPFTTSALGDGAHTLQVMATDAAGNTDATPVSQSFTVDTTPPQTTITAGPTSATSDSTPSFSFTSTQAGSSFECRVDTGAFAPCNSPHTTAALADGPHTFQVAARDSAGNLDETPASRSFTVDTSDTTPPETAITSGPSGTTTDHTPSFGFSSSEAGSHFECKLDAGAFAACSLPFTTGALSDGSHTFSVRAIDSLGNTDASPASRAFTVTTSTPPPPPPPQPPTATCEGKTATKVGGNGNDHIVGTPGNDVIAAGGGDDLIEAGGGKDLICAGSGNDTVSAGAGDDRLLGEAGNDRLKGDSGGDDSLGASGNDRLEGGSGDDGLSGQDGKDKLSGQSGNDSIRGGDGNDRAGGGNGKDVVRGSGDADLLSGDDGRDIVSGESGNDKLRGDDGRDRLKGGSGKDRIKGGSGNDSLSGQSGSDRLAGGSGNDSMNGGPGHDFCNGGPGKDTDVSCED